MNRYFQQVVGAKSRLDRLEADDIEIIRPYLERLERELAGGEVIQFQRVGDSFMVDGTRFRSLDGFNYLHKLLCKPGRYIAVNELDFVPGDELRQEMVDKEALRQITDDAKYHREASEDTRFRPSHRKWHKEQLAEINSYLTNVAYGGQPRQFLDNLDRCRQRVRRSIVRALDHLVAMEDTNYIGRHLQDNVKTGHHCIYQGKWHWLTD